MSTPTPSPTPASKLSIIFAGEMHDGSNPDWPVVTFLDGTNAAVFVRAMPARKLGAVINLALLEAELIDFVCMVVTDGVRESVPPGWADNLSDQSHIQLYEAAQRQNFTRATVWTERQIVAKKFTGELELMVAKVVNPMLQKMQNLLVFSPKPPALPAAPATKS